MEKNPCHYCPERYVNCHSDCERYKAYRQRLDEQKATKHKELELMAYTVDSIQKHQAKKNRR
jgi:hypothetical protein